MLSTLRVGLGNPSLRLVQGCYLLTELASWLWFVALSVYAYAEGGATAVSLAALARMLPAGLVAPLAGRLVDRLRRRDLLIMTVVAQAVLATVCAVVVASGMPLAAVIGAAAGSTIAAAAQRPTLAALSLEVADSPVQLAASNVIGVFASSAAFLVGCLLGGVVLAAADVRTAFVAVAGVMWLAVLPASLLPRAAVPEHRQDEDIAVFDGLRRVLADGDVTRLIGFLTVSTFLEGAVDVLLVVLALEVLQLGEASVGWLNAGWGVGGLVGALLCLRLLHHGRLSLGLALGGILIGAALLVLAVVPSGILATLLLVAVGIGYALVESAGRSLLQRLSADDVVGSAFAVQESGYWLSTAAGAAVAPLLVAVFDARGALLVAGCFLPPVVLLTWRTLVRFERSTTAPPEIYGALRALPVLAPLPSVMIEDLASHARVRDVSPGEVVVRRGEQGHHLFAVAEGTLDVSDCPEPVPPLQRGDYFGELALLHQQPRTATVTAREAGRVLVLDGSLFLSAVGSHAFTSRSVEQAAVRRWTNTERQLP